MSKPRQLHRVLSVLLCLCMLAGMLPAYALAADSKAAGSSELTKGSSIEGTDYSVTSLKNYAIAPDISEKVIITNNAAGNSQTVANVMEVNTAGGRAKIVAGYGNRNPKEQGWTLKTTTDQAHVYEKETGLNVVGGVNASWFNVNTGEPSGYLVMNGVVHHDNSSRAFIAAFDDGSVNVFREGTTLAQAEADQSAKQGKTVKILEAVDALVAMVWDGKVVVTESGNSGYYPRSCVGIKADGTVVLFQADGTMAPRSVGYTAAEEAQMMVALGCVAAIQLDEGGSSTYISQREGEGDLTMRNTPAGGSERVVSGTILVVSTVAASGEFDHAAVTPSDEYYTPGSSVTLTADAMDFSGAPAKALPEDAVFTVSDASMGTVTATDLSGSSASAVFTSSGKTGDVTVNLVSGGRTVGTAVLHIQNPDKLAFTSDEVALNYGETSNLGLVAKYQGETVHLQDADIQWDILSANYGGYDWTFTDGAINGGVSVSGTGVKGTRIAKKVFGYIISATIEKGTVTAWTLESEFNATDGKAPESVNQVLSDITWSQNESGQITGVFTRQGDTVTFTVDVPVLSGVMQSDGTVQWTAQLAVGSFNGLNFTATSERTSTIILKLRAAYGDLAAELKVNIGLEPKMILDGGDEDPWDYSTIGTTVESFSGMAANAVATYHYAGRGGVVKGSVVSDTDEAYADIVRFGHKAIKLEYNWTGLTGTDGACIGLGDNLAISGTPTALGVWVYIPEGVPVPWLRAQIATSTNGGQSWTNAYVNFSSGSAAAGEGLKTGWQYLEADLTQYAGALIRVNSGMLFRAMVTAGGIGWYTTDGVKLDKSELKGYILLDNLCVVYGANNQDVTAPVVNSIQLVNDDGTKTELEDGAVLNSGNLRFFVTYDDSEETDPYATGVESAYFYFDGTYRGTYDRDNLGSTSGLMHFGNGLHSITFYLKDGYGNVTRETRYFTVNAEQTDVPSVSLELQGQPTVGKTWELALSSSDPASITSLSANVSVSRSYPVTGVTFPDGVTGTYDYDAAKGVVSVSITAIDHAVYTAGALAVIAVDIPTSVAEGSSVNVQVTKGSYGCKQTEGLDISDLNQYATGFTTPVTNRPIEAMYRIQADTAVVGSTASAAVTVIRDGKAAAGVHVYANDVLLGDTDENGRIDISSLTASQGSVNLRAADEVGNCSYQITLFSYDAVGDETGAPYNVIYNLAPSADGKTITWMSNPAHSAARAVARISASADMTGAAEVEGTSRLISYSSSKQINRVNAVSLTGLEAGATYYYQVGDGSVWSDVRSFTVPAAEKQTRFFLLADIQEEAALEGMGRIAGCLGGQYHFGVQLGDAVDNVRYYNQWEDALSLFTLDGIRNTDMIHVIGNHEADDGGNNAIAAKSVFGVPAAWYSVERGDVYIAVLNHTSDKDTLQQFTQWLVEDAAKTTCTWKVLVTHVPAYYTNPTGGGETYVQYLPAACDAAGIDFYFSGNDHSYARTAPMVNGQVDKNGTVYYICGSTGGKSYSIVNNPDFHFDVATLNFDSVYVDVTADRFQATVTAYNVATDGTKTVLDQYTRRAVPVCQNDEHTYLFDLDTKELFCDVCGHTENAVDEKFSGFVREQESRRLMYLVAGVPLTGHMHYEDRFYFADDQGYAYDGAYNICGETCLFEGGFFTRSTTADVRAAGRSGTNVDFILYGDGLFKFMGTGENYPLSRVWNSPWYSYRNYVRRLYVDSGITNLDRWFAYSSRNLTEVTFAEGSRITRIDQNAFARCSSLRTLRLPETVTYIGYDAFTDCTSLRELYLPDGVNAIMPNAFTRDTALVLSVGYGSYAKDWAASRGIAYTEREPAVVASGVCGENLTWSLTSDGVLTLDGTGSMATYYGEANIPWHANRALITTVNVGAGVTKLTTNAFCGCTNLETVNFAENSQLQMLGGSAFKSCTSLKSITLPEGLTAVSGNAFKYCRNLRNVYLPDTMSVIDNLAFTGLSGITFSVAKDSYAKRWVESHGFAYTEREPAVVASGVCGENLTWSLTSDGVLTLDGTGSMATYYGEANIPWHANRALITTVNVGAGVTKLTTNAFCGCTNLETVNFAENSQLQMLGGSAFKSCTSLKSITLPEGLTAVSGNAFKYCRNLRNVYLPDTMSVIDNLAFTGLSGITFSVAKDSYAKRWVESHGFAYTEREPAVVASGVCGENLTWSLTSDGVLTLDGTGSMATYYGEANIPWHANRALITTVNVGAGVTKLTTNAFCGCTNLETVNFAENSQLQMLGGSAFKSCTSLKSITLPEGLTAVSGNAFKYCRGLRYVSLPDSTRYIDELAFTGLSGITFSVAKDSYAKNWVAAHGFAYVERENG